MGCTALIYIGIAICSIISFSIIMGMQLVGCSFPVEIVTTVWIQFILGITASVLHCFCFDTVVDCMLMLFEQCFKCICNINRITRFLHLSFLLPFCMFIVSIITDYAFYINQDFHCDIDGITSYRQTINSLYISQGVILGFSFIGFTTGLPKNNYEKVQSTNISSNNRYM